MNDSVGGFEYDYMISNFFDYESGRSEPVIKSRMKSALDYWENVIKAPPSVLNIINSGYVIDFESEPPPIWMNNNKSALKNKTFVDEAVKELLSLGLIEKTLVRPRAVNPLSVAENNGKKRLILDLSVLNEFVHYERISLEDQRDWYHMSKHVKYVSTYDIKSCYHQIDMHPESVTFLGFEWEIDGVSAYYVFLVLPFGLTSAPMVCKRIFRPLIIRWRSLGISTVIFFDDGVVGAEDFDTCEKHIGIVFSDLMKCHVLPNAHKSTWLPKQNTIWLGYEWDYEKGGVDGGISDSSGEII